MAESLHGRRFGRFSAEFLLLAGQLHSIGIRKERSSKKPAQAICGGQSAQRKGRDRLAIAAPGPVDSG